jgi:hypothetical protein
VRSTGRDPAFASSANSSDADAPPVWISEITRVDVGHATAAAATAGAPTPVDRGSGRRAASTSDAVTMVRITASSKGPDQGQRARDIDDLPAGLSDRGPAWADPDAAERPL